MNNYLYILIIILIIFLLYQCFIMDNTEEFIPFQVLTDNKHLYKMKKLVKKIITIFNKKNLKYWMSGGTLLGAVRDKGLIHWDDDVDFAYINTQKLLSMKKELNDNNLEIIPYFFGYKIFDISGEKIKNHKFKYPFIDLFTMVDNGNKYIQKYKRAREYWPHEIYYKNELYPLKLYDFDNLKLYGPNNPINYLDKCYKDWKIKGLKTFDHVTHNNFKKVEFAIEYDKNTKPYLWQYWDGDKSSFIKLSMETVKKHCINSFNVVELNNDNIFFYLPEMIHYKDKMKNLLIAQKVDIYRILLLYKYGGLYIDADTIVLRDPIEIMDKLQKYDFVGFGCTGNNCTIGYGKPSNWILAARPTSILMAKVLDTQLKSINNNSSHDYHDLGKLVIWKELDNLIKNHKYKYFHYPNKIDGSRDKHGIWITTNRALSNRNIEYEDEKNMMFFVYYNSGLDEKTKKISESDLLSKDWNITKFIKKSLNI